MHEINSVESKSKTVEYVANKPGRKTGTEVISVNGSITTDELNDIVQDAGGFENASTIRANTGGGLIQSKRSQKNIKTAVAHSNGSLTTKLMVDSKVINDPLSPFAGSNISKDRCIKDNEEIIGSMVYQLGIIGKSVKDIITDEVRRLPIEAVTEINDLRKVIAEDGTAYFNEIETKAKDLEALRAIDSKQWTDVQYIKSLEIASELQEIQEKIGNTVLPAQLQISAIISENLQKDEIPTI